MAKRWCARLGRTRGGRPQRAAIRLLREQTIVEVLAEQPELPELVGDVLPDVGHDTIRPDDDLLARLRFLEVTVDDSAGVLVDAHDPAAAEPTSGLQEYRP